MAPIRWARDPRTFKQSSAKPRRPPVSRARLRCVTCGLEETSVAAIERHVDTVHPGDRYEVVLEVEE